LEIIWTESALQTHLTIVDYLFEKWTFNEVMKFEDETNTLIRNLTEFNFICPASKLIPYRKCVINLHKSLIYLAEEEHIVMITFLHNSAAHNY
jgi:plasmid stabilization system protein ParE